jgi:hypothetical protein
VRREPTRGVWIATAVGALVTAALVAATLRSAPSLPLPTLQELRAERDRLAGEQRAVESATIVPIAALTGSRAFSPVDLGPRWRSQRSETGFRLERESADGAAWGDLLDVLRLLERDHSLRVKAVAWEQGRGTRITIEVERTSSGGTITAAAAAAAPGGGPAEGDSSPTASSAPLRSADSSRSASLTY